MSGVPMFEEEMEVVEPQTSKVWRIATFALVPVVVFAFFMLSLYLMELGTNPFRTGSSESFEDPFENEQQAVLSQGETAAPLTPVTASGGWDVITAAKEKRYGPETPRGYSPDLYSFKYRPKMFAPPEK